MFVVLCVFTLTPRALPADGKVLRREDYLRGLGLVPKVIPNVPQDDVEIRFGPRRVYMGEYVFDEIRLFELSIRFHAPPDSFSTLVGLELINSGCRTLIGLVINIPGGNVSRGYFLYSHFTPIDSYYGTFVLLAFPQEKKVDSNYPKYPPDRSPACNISGISAAFRLGPAMAVSVYERRFGNCETPIDKASKCQLWNWRDLPVPDLSSHAPYPRLEVEYLEGVSVRYGQCLPTFLAASPPAVVKFSATPGHYYTLFLLAYCVSESPKWLVANIPGEDFSRGEKVVPYPAQDDGPDGPCYLLLFSQGNRQIAVPEIKQLPSMTWKNASDKFKLGYPAALNAFWVYKADGVLPDGGPPTAPSIPSGPSRRRTEGTTPGISTTVAGSSMNYRWHPIVAGCLILIHVTAHLVQ